MAHEDILPRLPLCELRIMRCSSAGISWPVIFLGTAPASKPALATSRESVRHSTPTAAANWVVSSEIVRCTPYCPQHIIHHVGVLPGEAREIQTQVRVRQEILQRHVLCTSGWSRRI